MYTFPPVVVNAIRPALLRWYTQHRRRLPWRGDKVDPRSYASDNSNPCKIELADEDVCIPMSAYGTWVSEIMLQQTRIETVIPYWLRWMRAYPTVDALAAANIDDVNKLWAGLGYYRRAKQLLEGARKVVSDFGSVVPSSVPDLLSIPGIGPYTAGAVASIAYGKPEPLVDGNVIRVFSRLLAIPIENGDKLNKVCWAAARGLVDPEEPSSFNQALMELGATVCKPSNPKCESCPLSGQCKAFEILNRGGELTGLNGVPLKLESISDLPFKAPKKPPKELKYHVHVIRRCRDGRAQFMLVRRPSAGLLAGQWEFPMVPASDPPSQTEEEGEDKQQQHQASGVDDTDHLEAGNAVESNYSVAMQAFFHSTLGINTFLPELESLDTQHHRDTMKINNSVFLDVTTPIVHIFSHQKHLMTPILHDAHYDEIGSAGGTAGREVIWLELDEFDGIGITSGVKKVKAVLERYLASCSSRGTGAGPAEGQGGRESGGAASKKRAAPVSAAPISRYFTKVKKEA
jgi:A/G-specific adenine glycosylase